MKLNAYAPCWLTLENQPPVRLHEHKKAAEGRLCPFSPETSLCGFADRGRHIVPISMRTPEHYLRACNLQQTNGVSFDNRHFAKYFIGAVREGLDFIITQHCCCVVIPGFDSSGNLPPGIHPATWQEVQTRFGTDPQRNRLLIGLRRALVSLGRAGCRTAYLDGSFVTSKTTPHDFDACWDMNNVDISRLQLEEPVLLDFSNRRAAQKVKFGGELFPAQEQADATGTIFLHFFHRDKNTGDPKGIIAIDLRSV